MNAVSSLCPVALNSLVHHIRCILSAEQPDKALLAVWLVVLLLEGALVELVLAVRADKVLRVVLPIHGRHAAACHRPVASDAE